MPEIILFRHGQTRWNQQGRMQGQNDSPLTLKGIQQALNYGRALKSFAAQKGLDLSQFKLVSSPLPRCLQSLSILMEELELEGEVIKAPNLAEVNVGQWSGQLKSDLPVDVTHGAGRFNWVFQSPGGENYTQVHMRVSHWLDSQKPDTKMIVMSHGISGKILRGIWLGLDADETMAQDAPQDSFFHLINRKIERVST